MANLYIIFVTILFAFLICLCISILICEYRTACMGRILWYNKQLHVCRSRYRQSVPVLSVQLQSTNPSTSINTITLPHSDIPQAPPSVSPSPQPILPSYTVCVTNTSTADTQPSTCTTSDLIHVSAPPPSYSDAISNKDYSTIIVP